MHVMTEGVARASGVMFGWPSFVSPPPVSATHTVFSGSPLHLPDQDEMRTCVCRLFFFFFFFTISFFSRQPIRSPHLPGAGNGHHRHRRTIQPDCQCAGDVAMAPL
eukprot:TRINITY_DN1254_c7_g1_i3.p1 TRINITY_DN1254_c7_g1~~TRINITY_DN1254_c7_g1_i3.p1  ORF type:complete len:124 (+),score=6.92 TRINITY_DN1254_c7_g1_i3:56-373(+)